jgi:hypothetical protein
MLAYFLFYLRMRLWSTAIWKDPLRVKVLFYSSTPEDPGMGVETRLKDLVPAGRVEVYRSIEELTRRLQRLYDHDTIVILQAEDRKQLVRIVSLRDLFQGVRIILLVPDREEETIVLAHRLRPRFLSTSEGDFSDVMSVLQKMLGKGE